MMEEDVPVREPSRFLKTEEVVYVFTDASVRGLGSMMERADEKEICIRIGVWSTKEEEGDSQIGESSPMW